MNDDSADPFKPIITRQGVQGRKEDVLQVYRDGYANHREYAYTSSKQAEDYIDWMNWKRPEGFLMALSRHGELLGFAVDDPCWRTIGSEKAGEIVELVVSPKARGKKLGRKFMDIMIRSLEQSGCRTIGLEVGLKNKEAMNLYNHYGFKPWGNDGRWLLMLRESQPRKAVKEQRAYQPLASGEHETMSTASC